MQQSRRQQVLVRVKGRVYQKEHRAFCSLLSNKLTCTSNLKCSTLNNISNLSDIAISSLAKSSSYNARTRNTNIDNTVRLASTVKSTSHKWVIFRSITENHKLCCTNAISVLSLLGSSLDDASHLSNSVHIDTCFCAANINRRTDIISNRESLRNTLNKSIVTRSKALMHERRISTDKVYTDSFRRFVESFSKFNRIFVGQAAATSAIGVTDILL